MREALITLLLLLMFPCMPVCFVLLTLAVFPQLLPSCTSRLFCLNNMPIKRFVDFLQVGTHQLVT